jgi:hypothetical protein
MTATIYGLKLTKPLSIKKKQRAILPKVIKVLLRFWLLENPLTAWKKTTTKQAIPLKAFSVE